MKALHGTTLHGSVLRIEISANNKNKLGPRGGYRERKELSYDGRSSARFVREIDRTYTMGSETVACDGNGGPSELEGISVPCLFRLCLRR